MHFFGELPDGHKPNCKYGCSRHPCVSGGDPACCVGTRWQLRRPAARVISWIVCDLATVSVAALISLQLRLRFFPSIPSRWTPQHLSGREATAVAVAWFACLLVLVSRSYGLYGPLTRCSGLHEQRLNAQAALTAGLLLAGTLYLTRAEIVSRTVVLLTIVLTGALLAVRRGWWRYVIYKRHEQGVDVRNILIVGTSHVSKSLRSHLEAIRHLGFNFKGYIQFSPADREAPQNEILGTVHELISIARANFVDEIFVATPWNAAWSSALCRNPWKPALTCA